MALPRQVCHKKRGIFAELMRMNARLNHATSARVNLEDALPGSACGENVEETPLRSLISTTSLDAGGSLPLSALNDGASDESATALACGLLYEATVESLDAPITAADCHAIDDIQWTTLHTSLTSNIVSLYKDRELELTEPYAKISSSEIQDRIERNLRTLAALSAEIKQRFTSKQIDHGEKRIDIANSDDKWLDGRVVEVAVNDVLTWRLKEILETVGLRAGWEWELKNSIRGWVQEYASARFEDGSRTSSAVHSTEEMKDGKRTLHSRDRWSHNDVSGLVLAWLQYLGKIRAGVERAQLQDKTTIRMEALAGRTQAEDDTHIQASVITRTENGSEQYGHETAWELERATHVGPGPNAGVC